MRLSYEMKMLQYGLSEPWTTSVSIFGVTSVIRIEDFQNRNEKPYNSENNSRIQQIWRRSMETVCAKHEVFLCLKHVIVYQLLLSFDDGLGERNILVHTLL